MGWYIFISAAAVVLAVISKVEGNNTGYYFWLGCSMAHSLVVKVIRELKK
jgi:Uri superfamily endonuclease